MAKKIIQIKMIVSYNQNDGRGKFFLPSFFIEIKNHPPLYIKQQRRMIENTVVTNIKYKFASHKNAFPTRYERTAY